MRASNRRWTPGRAGLLLTKSMVLAAFLVGGGLHMADAMDNAAAERALLQGQVDQAVSMLQAGTASNQKDGQAHLLLCRAFYAEALADAAVQECERALETLAGSSEAQDWMGRAYGMKADGAGPLAGIRLARKVKTAFETAVALDAKNGAAANDLSEYYVEAPIVIGGGLDKAAALATQVSVQLQQQAHRMQALIAEKRKDYGTAEREFRAAVGVAGRPDAWIDLGHYYARRGRGDDAVATLQRGVAADRAKDASLVDAASILNELNREPQLAQRWLRLYLESGTKSDAAPAFKVHVQLGEMLAHAGDKGGAKIEFGKALAMASNYAPAKEGMQHA